MAFKRKRVYAPRRAVRKKSRRTFKRRARRVKAQLGNHQPVAFRRNYKKLSKRRFRNLLWRQTMTAHKFHSYYAQTDTITTPASASGSTTKVQWALGVGNHSYEPFWTANGGLQANSAAIGTIADPTESKATFNSDIIIRGGTFSFEIYNDTETGDVNNDIVRCKVILMKTSQTRDDADFQAMLIPGNPIFMNTPDVQRRVGYVCCERDFTIKDGESASMQYKIPCQKIDVGAYMNEAFTFILYVTVANGFGASAQPCHFRYGHNITFCGDAAS